MLLWAILAAAAIVAGAVVFSADRVASALRIDTVPPPRPEPTPPALFDRKMLDVEALAYLRKIAEWSEITAKYRRPGRELDIAILEDQANWLMQNIDPLAQPTWKPMRWAPTDGSRLLLVSRNKHTGEIYTGTGYWDDSRGWVHRGYGLPFAWRHNNAPKETSEL